MKRLSGYARVQKCNCKNCLHVAKVHSTLLSASPPVKKRFINDAVFVWNETLRHHPCTNRLSLSSVRLRTQSVGPTHDPYHRETYTISRNGRTYTIASCALAGYSFEVDGKAILKHGQNSRELEAIVEKHTGFPLSVWEKAYQRTQRDVVCDSMYSAYRSSNSYVFILSSNSSSDIGSPRVDRLSILPSPDLSVFIY